MNTKKFSNEQEKKIADFLGWSLVSGSGARMLPGDIQNEYWLGECKTHIQLQDNIIFYKQHWDKIKSEAQSVFKYPILFVDNGSQRIENTWALFGDVLAVDEYDVVALSDIKIGVNIRFVSKDIKYKYHKLCAESDRSILFYSYFGKEKVYILPLQAFFDNFI